MPELSKSTNVLDETFKKYNLKPEHFWQSYSSDQTFDSCPRKYECYKLLQIKFDETDGMKDLAMNCGKAMHVGYQEFLASHNIDLAIFKMLLEYPTENFKIPKARGKWSIEACIASMDYLSTMVFEKPAMINNKPAIETSFSLKLGENIQYVGYIDLIYEDFFSNSWGVEDYKSHTDWRDDLSYRYKHSEQCIPYSFVIAMLNDPEGNQESFQEVKTRFFAQRIELSKSSTQVYDYTITEKHVTEWLTSTYMRLNLIKYYTEMEHFPKKQQGCFKYGKLCEYFDYCDMANEDLQYLKTPEKDRRAFKALITVDLT